MGFPYDGKGGSLVSGGPGRAASTGQADGDKVKPDGMLRVGPAFSAVGQTARQQACSPFRRRSGGFGLRVEFFERSTFE